MLAVKAVLSDVHIQHCIVHVVHSLTKLILCKELKTVYRDLREVNCDINVRACNETLQEIGKMES